MLKINEQALKEAARKLRKLRLTDNIPLMDAAPPSETVKSVFKTGLGGLYADEAIEYMLKFGIKYYLQELSTPHQSEEETNSTALEWEKIIAQIVMEHGQSNPDCLDKDIQSLLASQREEIVEEIENMKKVCLACHNSHKSSEEVHKGNKYYNKAIDDILDKLSRRV